jgi:hypothetical protein
MITTILLVAVALLVIAVILVAVHGHGEKIANVAELQGKLRPVDVLAFRNLVDPEEENYLREHLPSGEFRRIQRERMRAAIDYVQCVAGNAAVLLRLGEAARESADPEVANAGKELVESALRIRISALSAGVRLRVRIVMPGLQVSPSAVSNSYENLTGLVGRLGRLQHRSGAMTLVS